MCHVITNGESYILRKNNEFSLTKDKNKAQRFSESMANNVLNNLPKIYRNKSLSVIELEPEPKNNIFNEISDMDGAYQDFDLDDVQNDNKYIYRGKTYMEENDFDFVEFINLAITVFSQLDDYIENMGFLEREADLKLMDIRHYKRDPDTRMNGVEAQTLQYYEQDLERERIVYKRNRSIATIFNKNLDRIKNKNYISVINRMAKGEYKYRRLRKDQIKLITRTKRAVRLKEVV